MKKTLTTWMMLLAVVTTSQAQMIKSETITVVESNQGIDLSKLGSEETATAFRRAQQQVGRTQSATSWRWIDRINNMPAHMREFFTSYESLVNQAIAGNDNCLTNPELGTTLADDEWCMVIKSYQDETTFTYPKDANNEVIAEYARQKAKDICNEHANETFGFMGYLCMCLTYDIPQAFWLHSSFNWGHQYSYSFNYYPGSTTGTLRYNQAVKFILKSANFHHLRDEFTDPTVLRSAITEFNGLVAQLITDTPKDSWRYYAIDYLDTWLTTHNCYNTLISSTPNSVPTIAWSPLSALRGSTGGLGPVCEGYARAFKVLCDRLGIPCALCTGFATSSGGSGEAHMWNEVQMENGLWYAMDVTWDDPYDSQGRAVSGYENKKWFLLGSQDQNNGYTFAQSHPNGSTWTISAEDEARWDYSLASLITTNRYDLETDIAGISGIKNARQQQPTGIYSLSGQRRSQPQRGINIVNGQKVICP